MAAQKAPEALYSPVQRTPAEETFVRVPSVAIKTLQSPLVTNEWEQAVETLYLSLKQHNVCILKVSDIMAKGNQKLMDKAVLDVLASSPGPSTSSTPVIRRSPGKATCSLRLGSAQLHHYPDSVVKLAPVAFACLENVAKTALSAVCRSCHVRMRGDTFQSMMDDFPLAPGAVSSSELTVSRHKASLAASSSATPWSLQRHNDGTHHLGLLTLFCQQQHRTPTPDPHRLQVLSAKGDYQNIELQADDVAVLVGHTAETASAGVLTAAPSRVVGGVGPAATCAFLEFQLNARRNAVMDIHPALKSAGHSIAEQYHSPMQLSTLTAQFDAVMTPAARTSLGGAACPAVEISALRNVPHRTGQRNKRQSLRSTASPARKLRRASAPQELPATSRGQENDEPGTERMCITIDGQGRRKSDFIRISVLSSEGSEMLFQLHPTTELSRLFEVYCGISGLQLKDVKFQLEGQRLLGSDTARTRNIQSGMAMQIMPLEVPLKLEPETAALQCVEAMQA